MKGRTLLAILGGIILGYGVGFYVRNMGYTGLFPILLGSVLNPLIVYGIADRGAIWVSVVPNVTLVLTLEAFERYSPPDRISHILTVSLALTIMAIFALVAIAPSYWLRNKRAVKAEGRKRLPSENHLK